MKKITVGIKTFLRPHTLALCLEALRGFDVAEVIIADDNPESLTEAYEMIYAQYRTLLPLHVLRLPFDTGLAASRNALVAATTTEFLLMLDDDHVVNHTVSRMYDVLTSDAQIGGVSCFFNERNAPRCTACDLYLEDQHIIKALRRIPEIYTTENGSRYSFFEFIPSATLFRLASCKDVPWDPFYKIGAEHLDFYLRQKEAQIWKFAVALDAHIDHLNGATSTDDHLVYQKHRNGEKLKRSWEYFKDKFSVQGKVEGKKLADTTTV